MDRTIEVTAPVLAPVTSTSPLLTDAEACLAGSSRVDATGRHLTRITFTPARGTRLQQEVALRIGAPTYTGATRVWSLEWDPIADPVVLPGFAGRLSLRLLDRGGVLRLTGTIRPPLGMVGLIVDTTVAHRVAEVVAENFLRIAARRVDGPGRERRLSLVGGGALPAEHWLG